MCNFHELEEVLKEPSLAIYESHRSVSKEKPYYQLHCTDIWNGKEIVHCNQTRGVITHPFVLLHCTPNGSWVKRSLVTELTEEMKSELIKMGYTICT